MTLRRRTLAWLGAALLLVALAPISLISAAAGPLEGRVICLDPGHGGSDPGAVYDDGTLYLEEEDINLDVSLRLQELLQNAGAQVVLTRTDDTYLTNADRYNFANAMGADILVSVHTNSVADPAVDGGYALYFQDDDRILAQAIYDVMYPALRDTAPAEVADFRSFGLSKFASGVLMKSNMPAAMMEPLFMSHPAEAALLAEPIYASDGSLANLTGRRAQIADSIYQGILSYFQQNPTDPGDEPGDKPGGGPPGGTPPGKNK